MVGCPSNNNARMLQQWSSLFECYNGEYSLHALTHWKQVQKIGWPTEKHEHWKYTPLETLFDQKFIQPSSQSMSIAQCDSLSLNIEAYRLIFINGRFSSMLSDSYLGDYKFELVIKNSAQLLPEPIQSEFFLHLTESLAQERSIIYLSSGKVTTRPLYLLHISSGKGMEGEVNTMHHRHHLIIDHDAKAEIIEHYVSLNDTAHFTGARLTANIDDNAHLLHYKLVFENNMSYHFSHNDLVIGRDACVKSNTFLLGSGLTRHNTSAQLNGTGADLDINSLMLPMGKEICDTRTYIEHNQGYCKSRQLHKTVVNDTAKAVFNGLIKVSKNSIKSDSQMMNHNLLLNKLAEVNTKPQLEIYADDVKCSHGATVGYIDLAQLFYMQSRGINKDDAQKIIIFAFAIELTEKITNKNLRELILMYIVQRLSRENA